MGLHTILIELAYCRLYHRTALGRPPKCQEEEEEVVACRLDRQACKEAQHLQNLTGRQNKLRSLVALSGELRG